MTFAVLGGGSTETRQVGDGFFVRSYNSPSQKTSATWLALAARRFPGFLNWPSPTFADPTFMFVSPELLRTLEADLATARANREQAGAATTRYDVTSPGGTSLLPPRIGSSQTLSDRVSVSGWMVRIAQPGSS